MSTEAMVWVLYNSHTTCGTDKVVLLGIASHADAYGRNAWPSHETLAGYANVDERNVRRCLARLKEQGHITIDVQAGGSTKTRSDRRPNLYTIPGCEGFPDAIRRGGASAPSRSDYGGARVTERGGAGVRSGGALAPSELSLNSPEHSYCEEQSESAEMKQVDRLLRDLCPPERNAIHGAKRKRLEELLAEGADVELALAAIRQGAPSEGAPLRADRAIDAMERGKVPGGDRPPYMRTFEPEDVEITDEERAARLAKIAEKRKAG